MKIIEKNLDRREWYPARYKQFQSMYHRDAAFEGGLGLITFVNMPEPDVLSTSQGDKVLADNGYRWLELAPKGGNWVMTAMYRPDGGLFQIYFDITRENVVSENGGAVFYDMFLDVLINEEQDVFVLDEDELKQALDERVISRNEYETAVKTAEQIVGFWNTDREAMIRKLEEYRDLFSGRQEYCGKTGHDLVREDAEDTGVRSIGEVQT